MRVAQVSPLFESVPPRLYGGTERVVFNLTEALIEAGHEVTLFASGDSTSSARLLSPCERSLRLADHVETLSPHLFMFEQLKKISDQFDVVHFHTEIMHFNLVRHLAVPTLSTLHGRLDYPSYPRLFMEFNDVPVVSISDQQRGPVPFARWMGTVYHGFDPKLFHFGEGGEDLVFIGRICPEKGLCRAIEIARRSGRRLKVAAKIDAENQDYYLTIRHLLREPFVDFLGEIGEAEKIELLSRSAALVFPINWPEPFGLVMIEAMACGTPVIAFRQGSVPEIIAHGRTGFVVHSVDEAVQAVGGLSRIDRRICRREFEARFSRGRMARDYVWIYEALMARERFESAGDSCPDGDSAERRARGSSRYGRRHLFDSSVSEDQGGIV